MADFKINGRIFTVEESDIRKNMAEMDLDRADAVRMYFEDSGIIEGGSKTSITEIETVKQKRRYEKSGKPRKKAERVRKVDEEKKSILSALMGVIDAEKTVKNEAEFSFTLNGNSYTVKLIKHRPSKAVSEN